MLAAPSCACSIYWNQTIPIPNVQGIDVSRILLQGLVSKETIRGIYDGTWFYQQADKIEAENAKKAATNGRNGHKD